MRVLPPLADERKHGYRVVAGLLLHERVVERLAVEPRRRSGFQPGDIERQLTQARRQPVRGLIADSPAGLFCPANEDATAKKRPGGQDHGPGAVCRTGVGDDTGRAAALDDEVVNGRFDDLEVRLAADNGLDGRPVQFPIRLRPRRAHRRALGCIERTKLDARHVDRARHRAAQRVDFLCQVALADAADGRVAAHLPQRVEAMRHEQRPGTRARGSQGGFRTGVTAANDDDVIHCSH